MELVVLEVTVALAAVALMLFAGAHARPQQIRATPRPRRLVGPRVYALARRCGFRYSRGRDALVLNGVGWRWGPVLRLREGGGPPPHEMELPAPEASARVVTAPLTLPARAADERARSIDVVCMPLPRPHRAHRLWQLTAVEVESRFVWVELTRTRGEPPSPQLAARFVRDVRRDLEARGLRLDAIVVRSGGAQRWPQIGAVDATVRQRRLPPGLKHERLAATMHARALSGFWNDVFARDEVGSLDALRRGLDEWTKRRNEQTLAAEPAPAAGS